MSHIDMITNNCGNCKRGAEKMSDPTCTKCRLIEEQTKDKFKMWEAKNEP